MLLTVCCGYMKNNKRYVCPDNMVKWGDRWESMNLIFTGHVSHTYCPKCMKINFGENDDTDTSNS